MSTRFEMAVWSLAAAMSSAVSTNDIAMASIGMPMAGVAACFFGALFGMLFIPAPPDDQLQRRVPVWLALPTLWAVGVFLGAGVCEIAGWKNPATIAAVGLIISATPVPIVRALSGWVVKKFGG